MQVYHQYCTIVGLELMGNSNSGIAYLKKKGIGIEVCYKEIKSKNVFTQKYFFHDNPTWNINYLE